jgi:hypothetical protein
MTKDLSGSPSVYCINQQQMAEALRLAEQEPQHARKIAPALACLDAELTRNERAALAFVLIKRLSENAG